MKEEVINRIKYRLDEDNLNAEVIELKEKLKIDEKLPAKKLMEMLFNGYKGDIIIPEAVEYKGYTYRVTSIGAKAFRGSYSLKSVTIPDSVTSIGEKAFEDCRELKSIVIPDSVTSIGERVFLRCESLTTQVVIDEKIIGGIKYLLYCNRTAKIIQKDSGYKGDIIIPETVEYKGRTYRVTSVGEEAFTWCTSLKSIVIPDGVTSLGERAFSNCCKLSSITIPDSVTSIGSRAFENCYKLSSIIIPNNILSIEDLTFSWCFALTEIVIPNSVKNIGYAAFESCSSLKSIVIPARVTEIGERAFCGCSALTSIIVAEGNPRYDSRENCNAIIETATNTLIRGCSQTIIPESVTEIGEGAFNHCKSLASITIPEGVISIGNEAFRFCESLISITFQGTIAQWEKIELGYGWNDEIPTDLVHCTDGDVQI